MKTLFINGTIHSLENETKTYKYLGIDNDKISYLGDILPKDKYHQTVDLHGNHIFPSLTDSHLHLLYSLVLSAYSFNICKIQNNAIVPNSLNRIEKAIKDYCLNHPKSNFIMINQYIVSAIKEGRLPNKSELDAWTNNREVVIFTIDGHSCSMSSSLLKSLDLESEDGILSGPIYDMNQGKITSYAAKNVSLVTLAKGVANFTNECIKYGITKVCALDGEDNNAPDTLLTLLTFIAQRMSIEVRLYPQYHNFDILKKYRNKMLHPRVGGCSKWELDGSIGSHSAAFYHSYKDNNQLGELYYSQDYVNSKVKEALINHYQFTCHAIGTKAIDEICNAYKANETLIPNSGIITRIDHFEFPSKEALNFVYNHRIAITMQPGYSYYDKRYIKSYERFLANEDFAYMAPLKEMVKHDVLILGSCDSPVQELNPYVQILGMVDYYNEEESLSNYEALKTYTINPSIVLDEKDGILKEGYQASFMIVKDNLLSLDKAELSNTQAKVTYLNGKKLKPSSGSIWSFIKLILRKPHKI